MVWHKAAITAALNINVLDTSVAWCCVLCCVLFTVFVNALGVHNDCCNESICQAKFRRTCRHIHTPPRLVSVRMMLHVWALYLNTSTTNYFGNVWWAHLYCVHSCTVINSMLACSFITTITTAAAATAITAACDWFVRKVQLHSVSIQLLCNVISAPAVKCSYYI